MRIAVYTSMFPSSYGKIVPPFYVNEDVDYFCITDGALHLKSGELYDCPPYQVKTMERQYENNRLESRVYKFLPHMHLPEYDWTIWHGATSRMRADPVEIINAVQETGYNMMLLSHPWRTCMYQELEFCKNIPKPGLYELQVSRYREEGFPENNGLAACTFIVRNNRDPKVREFNQFWWDEYIRAGNPRDQCCFEYCVWKTGIKYLRLNKRAYRWSGNELYAIGRKRVLSPTLHITLPLERDSNE